MRPICIDSSLHQISVLKKHMESDHDTSSVTLSWSCIVCDKKFKTDAESLEHLTSDHKTEEYKNKYSVKTVEEEKETSESVKEVKLN